MAHRLGFRRYISETEWIEINLLAWRTNVQSYTPQAPTLKQDGTYNDVTETIELLFVSTTSTMEVQTDVNAIQRWMALAAERQARGTGDRIFMSLDGETDYVWRSEILGGAVNLADGALQIWGGRKLPNRITFTRRYFWEGGEFEIPLSSQTQSAIVTGGRLVQNRRGIANGAMGGNWVEIGVSQIGGVLPTPAKIMIAATTGSNEAQDPLRDIYIASSGAIRYPTSLTTVLEGEDALSSTGTVRGASSGDATLDLNFSGAQSISKQWIIPYQTTSLIAGRTVRLFTRHAFFQGGALFMNASLKANDGTAGVAASYDSEVRVLATEQLQDIGAITFPSSGSNSMDALRLQIDFRSTATALIELDYIMMLVGNVRTLYNLKQVLAPGRFIVDDGPRGISYQLYSTLEDMS